jgi:hypothetical protein
MTRAVGLSTNLRPIESTNPVVALCAAGMACDGGSEEARSLFEEAWKARWKHLTLPSQRLVYLQPD